MNSHHTSLQAPRISGFTLVRNGERFDYPYRESIRSLAPIVDELIVNVGIGDDATLSEVKKLAAELNAKAGFEKIKFFESEWPLNDPEKKKSGLILAEQTNLALERCTGDWVVYLQADEILHEADYGKIRGAVTKFNADPGVEGLLFDYVHFYGSFDVVQYSRSAYRREVRAFKCASGARSVGDAQSFRKPDGSKLQVVRIGARVFHYGWVRPPLAMREKTFFMDQLYHGDKKGGSEPHTGENYRYKRFWGLHRYEGDHPAVMRERIAAKNWNWDFENAQQVWSKKDVKKVVLDSIEKLTGVRLFEYRSYRRVRRAVENLSDRLFPSATLMLATYEMPVHLSLVCEALKRQSRQDFEVIICDDGSGEKTRAIIEDFQKSAPFRVEHVWQEHDGFRKCRVLNEGLRRSRAPILVFLDGDCVPHRDFIRDHIENQQSGRYLAGRRVELGEPVSRALSVIDVRRGFFDRPNLKLAWSFFRGGSEHFNRIFRWSNTTLRKLLKMDRIVDLKGCNYSVPRWALEAINGFDEAYEGYGREDTDAELRLQNLGLKIKSLKGLALQYHVWHPRREFTPANDDRLEKLKVSRRVRCEQGWVQEAR